MEDEREELQALRAFWEEFVWWYGDHKNTALTRAAAKAGLMREAVGAVGRYVPTGLAKRPFSEPPA